MPDINLFPTLRVKFYFSLQNRPLTASVVFGFRLKHGCSSPAGRGEQHALCEAGRDRKYTQIHILNNFWPLTGYLGAERSSAPFSYFMNLF